MSPFYLTTMPQIRNTLQASLIMNYTQNDDFTTHLAPGREGMFNDNGNQDEAAIFEALILFFMPRNYLLTPLTTFLFLFFYVICRCIDLPLYPFFILCSSYSYFNLRFFPLSQLNLFLRNPSS